MAPWIRHVGLSLGLLVALTSACLISIDESAIRSDSCDTGCPEAVCQDAQVSDCISRLDAGADSSTDASVHDVTSVDATDSAVDASHDVESGSTTPDGSLMDVVSEGNSGDAPVEAPEA